ncbi:hypothetical protein D3C73_1512340 [compost metagenome]
MSEAARVEIHLRLLDCQICGSEINPDREEYIGRKRVCRRCYDSLTCGPDRMARKYGYIKKVK